MLIYEYKLDGNKAQYIAIDEAIRTVQFIRNKCLRFWMGEHGMSKNNLQCYCATLAHEYSFANNLNSQARQAAADRAWFAGRKAILSFSTITEAWNTKSLDGSWMMTENTSPSPMAVGLAV